MRVMRWRNRLVSPRIVCSKAPWRSKGSGTSGGSLNGVTADSPTTLDVLNIVDQLDAKHVTWKAYMQSLNDCVSGVSTPSGIVGETSYKFDAACGVAPYGAQLYERKHNPFVTYDDVANNAARMANIVDLSQFTTDLANNKLPEYSWISPDQCHDMHGTSTAGSPCDYSQEQSIISMGDAFLKQTVHQIMSSRVWKENTAIFVTWDEADYTGAGFQGFGDDSGCCDSPSGEGGGHVLTLVITKQNQARNGQRVSFVPYNHFSMLSTIEKNFGLPCLANTCDIANVKPMTGLK